MSYDPIIQKAAETYGLDPNLIRAVVHQESGGKRGAISPKGAGGLMQLMPACVTTDTECFTKEGWKKYSELIKGELIFTYNLEKECLELQPVNDVFYYKDPQSLIRMHNKSFDFIVTPNHKWVVFNPSSSDKSQILKETHEIANASANRIIKVSEYLWPTSPNISDALVYVLGIIFADGSIGKNGKQIDLYQKDKVEKFAKALDDAGIASSVRVKDCGTSQWCITGFSAHQISSFLYRKGKKRLPLDTVLKLTKKQSFILWQSLLDTDASNKIDGFQSYCQSDADRAQDIQNFLFLMGNDSCLKMVRESGTIEINGRVCTTQNKYQAHVKKRKVVSATTHRLNYTPVKAEPVWCPSVKNKTWIAKRNGIISITGNTAKELGVTDRFDPEQNIMAGSKYLKQNIDHFNDIDLGVAAYNAGAGAVNRYGGIPPYKETRNYVKSVRERYQKLASDALTGLGNAIISPANAQEFPDGFDVEDYKKFVAAKTQKQPEQDYGYGARPDGSKKGRGFLGELKMQDGTDGVATEKTIGVEMDGKETNIPAIVPTLSKEQLDYILKGGDINSRKDIIQAAAHHAAERMRKGLSPYADNGDPEPQPEQTQLPDGFDVEDYKRFVESKTKATKIDPTEGMSALDKGLAGMGSTFMDYGQGLGQALGMVSPEDVAEKRRLDKPLMDTTAGKVGGALGHVAAALPSVAIPGAATLGGAAKIGALYGVLQPSESNTETLQNTALGAGSNALGVGVGKGIGKTYDLAEAIVNPLLTNKGVTSVANNTLERFAENPQAVRQAIKDAIEGKIELTSETGAKHTLAELTRDRGIATLQDALGAADPQLKSAIQGRLSDNMAGRVESLNKLAGTSAERETAMAARDAAAKPLYNEAFKKSIPITPELKTLLDRPSVASALPRSAKLAKEEGRTFGFDKGNAATKYLLDSKGKPIVAIDGTEGSITGQTLHDLKMGMDALLKDPNSGIAGQEINAVKSTRAELLKHIEDAIPDYGKARVAYSEKSNPINAMDIGEHITKKAYANIKDLGGNERLQANALSGLMKDPKRLIEQATGRKGLGKQLEKILSPDQMRLLSKVVQESDRASAIQSAGNGPGSATAQRTVATNILAQVLPKKAAGSNIAQTLLGKPLNLLYSGITEPKVQAELVDLLLNPQNAKLYTNKEFTNRIGQLLGVGGMSAAIEGSK